jgi:hypothetical protein
MSPEAAAEWSPTQRSAARIFIPNAVPEVDFVGRRRSNT